MLKERADDIWFHKKFAEEVEALARIDHPGVVGVMDAGGLPDGTPFVVLQFVSGTTLRKLLGRGLLPLAEAASIIRQIGQALTAAHDCGVWHRDLKPENIMVQDLANAARLVKIIDFGIASVRESKPPQSATSDGSTGERTRVAGSLPYMAPEQLNGAPCAASDIYALGVIACEILTGRRPFRATSDVELIVLQLRGLEFRLHDLRPGLPASVHEIVSRGLSFKWADRQASAGELGNALADALVTQPSQLPTREVTPRPELIDVFDPWKPAAHANFVGRAPLLQRIHRALDEGRSTSVVGDWRVGKTSLLGVCFEKVKASGRQARFLSGEGSEGSSPSEFVRAATGMKSGDEADAAAEVLSRWAHKEHKPGLLPILIVDEFDAILRRFDPRFFVRLRGMLDYLALVVSSRRELDQIYAELGASSPFHNRLELQWVGLLEPEAADRLVRRGAPYLSQSDRDLMLEWAGCHPFFLQLFGRKLMDALRFGEAVHEAQERFQTEAAARLRELWTTLSLRDRESLVATVSSPNPNLRMMRNRGLLDPGGKPFGRVLTEWLREEVA